VAAFKHLGNSVEAFYWQNYFSSSNPLVKLWRRAQNKFLIGPTINRLNRDLVKMAVEFEPKLIFIYRGTHITPSTLVVLKRALPVCELFGYNNDDPFAAGHPPWLWRHFMNCVPIYDLVFAYRKHNLAEYQDSGAKRVKLLMPWFLPEKDIPLAEGEAIANNFDIVFVGHYESDERIEYLQRLSESNFTFGLFGPDWDRAPECDWLKKHQPVLPVRGNKYREILISSKVALCFLSSLNRDTYTRRCFEIPAIGVFMLCQYSDDLAQIYEDGVDAVFFHNPDDMIEKIEYYTRHDELREQIAANGRARVVRDKHDIASRMDYVLNQMTIKEH
jgi:glycosyltransferase involved in cell wall biosynthesis